MQLRVCFEGKFIMIRVGSGSNNIRWLALKSALKVAKLFYPHMIRLPMQVSKKCGRILKPRAIIRDVLVNLETVILTLIFTSAGDVVEKIGSEGWFKEAFGRDGNLCSTEILWKVDPSGKVPIPRGVRGTVSRIGDSDEKFSGHESPMEFDIPLQPIKDAVTGEFAWVADLRSPPGVARFTFYTANDSSNTEVLNENLIVENGKHSLTVNLDLPVFRPDLSAECAQEYSSEFLNIWSSIELVQGDESHVERIKSRMNSFFEELKRCFCAVASFYPGRERFITAEDLAYILNLKSEADFGKLCEICIDRMGNDGKISFPSSIQVITLWANSHGSGDTEVDELFQVLKQDILNEEKVYNRELLIFNARFPKIAGKLGSVYSRQRSPVSESVKRLMHNLRNLVSDPDELSQIITFYNLQISVEEIDIAVELCNESEFIPFLRFVSILASAFDVDKLDQFASLLVAHA